MLATLPTVLSTTCEAEPEAELETEFEAELEADALSPLPPKARVLLIEDESCLAQMIALELTEAGYDVTTVSSGLLGLDKTRSLQPDLLLLDWGLPGIDGIEVCRKLRQQGSRIPVIMVTSRSEEEGKPVAIAAGACDYMMKPFSLDELLEKMERSLAAL